MSHVISIASPTENSGKTITASNLAVSLAISEKKTLLIDCDPKQGASYAASTLASLTKSAGFYSVMTDRNGISESILASSLTFLRILPAGADFSKADFLFGDTDGHYFKLRDLLESITDDFEYIIIDSPSNMPNLLKNVMMATDWVVIPLDMDFKSPAELLLPLSDIKNLFQLLLSLRDQFQVYPKILGILLNKFRQIGDLSDRFPNPVLESIEPFFLSARIPVSKDISEGLALGKPAAFRNIGAEATAAFMDFSEELMEKINHMQKNIKFK